ncbi:MAG: tetratricopeptide repeat protein [Pirellulaceae bacterium]
MMLLSDNTTQDRLLVQNNCIRTTLVLAALVIALAGTSACANPWQETAPQAAPPNQQAIPPQLPPTEVFPGPDLDELRSELERQSQMLDHELQTPGPPPAAIVELLSDELETSRRVEELGNKMLELVELQRARQLQAKLLEQSTADTEPSATEESVDANNGTPFPLDITPEQPLTAQDAAQDAPGQPRTELTTIRVLDQPPDQLALADNLFYSGEFELAEELYRTALEKTAEGPAKIWLRFQLASCLRHTGQIDEAKKLLRAIMEESDGNNNSEVAAGASWWLDTIDKKQNLQRELSILEEFTTNKEVEYGIDQ